MAKKKQSAKKVTAKTKTKAKAKPVAKAKKTTTAMSNSEGLPIDKIASGAEKARSKGDILKILAESTGMAKKDISKVLERLSQLINLDIGRKGPGIFTLPGLVKIVRVMKPATKARKGVNPFTGQETTFKAKPARNIVKVRALKALKEMVG
jgi:hypothetical protein